MADADLHPKLGQPVNTSDPAEVEKAKIKAARHESEERAVLASMLQTRAGRRWVWNLLSRCNVYATSFVVGDPHATSFNEGGRNVGLSILAQVIRAAPEQYAVMQKEADNG